MADRIEVVIKRKRRGRGHGSAPRRDIGSRRRESEYLPRRLSPGLTLNFWDLGSHNQGTEGSPSFVDLDFTYAPAIPLNGGGYPSGSMTFGPDAFSAMKAKILEVPLAEFDWRYRKFGYEDAARFGVDLYVGDPGPGGDYPEDAQTKQLTVGKAGARFAENNFEFLPDATNWQAGKGMVFTAKQDHVSVIAQSGFMGFGRIQTMVYNSSPAYKITSVDDPAAPAASFAWGGAIDVFLVPRPIFVLGFGIDNVFPGFQNTQSMMGMFFAIQSRDIWLENEEAYSYWATYLGHPEMTAVGGLGFSWGGFSPGPVTRDLLNDYKYYLDSKYYVTTDHGLTGTETDPTTWPAPISDSDAYDYGVALVSNPTTFGMTGLTAHYVTGTDTLLAILRKGNQWFYMWAAEALDSSDILVPIGHITTQHLG